MASSTNAPSAGQQAVAAAAGAVPGLIARLMSNPNGNIPPQLTQLLQNSVDRTNYQNPLFQAVTNQAFQGLPTYARQGLSLGNFQPTPAATNSSDGGIPPWLAAALGAGGGMALDKATGGNALGALIDGLKKLFGGGGGSVQGNKPNAGGAMTGPQAYDPNSFMGWGDLFSSDPTAGYGNVGLVSDPSGGTGIGPGMQAYYGGRPIPPNPDEE